MDILECRGEPSSATATEGTAVYKNSRRQPNLPASAGPGTLVDGVAACTTWRVAMARGRRTKQHVRQRDPDRVHDAGVDGAFSARPGIEASPTKVVRVAGRGDVFVSHSCHGTRHCIWGDVRPRQPHRKKKKAPPPPRVRRVRMASCPNDVVAEHRRQLSVTSAGKPGGQDFIVDRGGTMSVRFLFPTPQIDRFGSREAGDGRRRETQHCLTPRHPHAGRGKKKRGIQKGSKHRPNSGWSS